MTTRLSGSGRPVALLVVALIGLLALAVLPGRGRAPAAAAGRLHQTGTGTTTVPVDALVAERPTTTSTATTEVPAPAEPTSPVVTAGPPPGGVALADQTDWSAAEQPFDLWVTTGADVGPQDVLTVDVHGPITSRSQFTATLDGDLLGGRRARYAVPLGELPRGPGGTWHLRLTPAPTGAPGQRELEPLPRPGVYPMVVSLQRSGPEPATGFTTYLVRTPEPETTPLLVAVLQPVGADPSLQPDGAVALTTGELDALEGLAGALASTAGTPITLRPRPETVQALQLLAATSADPRSAQAARILGALVDATAGRAVVSTPFVDLDLDALEAAGLGDEVAAQRQRGDDVLRATLGVGTDRRTWVDGGAGRPALDRLSRLGVERVVLPDGALGPVDLRLSLSRPFALAAAGGAPIPLEAAAPDPALSARYAGTDPVLAAQHLLADLAVLHGDEPGPLRSRGVVVAPPDQVRTDPVMLERLLDGLASAPMLDPVTVGAWFDLVDAEGEDVGEPLVREVTASDARIGITASEVADARSSLQGLDAVVIPTGPTATPQLSDLVLLAEADGLATEERRRYLGAVGDGVAERLGSVRVVDGASFRLPDSEGTIPLTIVRDGGTPLSVRVLLESTKLEFDDATATQPGSVSYELELTNENTPLVVPVRVRSPGTFPLLITITSPDGRLELVRDQVTIHSTAFSGVGVALSAGAGLFLLLWWARHWRTVRRAKRLVPVP